MKGILYIGNDNVGEVNFTIIDESMGGIGGNLIANDDYKKYQSTIQQYFVQQGIANVSNFNFRIALEDNFELKPAGGIGITDAANFDEIYVEVAGLDAETMNKIKRVL